MGRGSSRASTIKRLSALSKELTKAKAQETRLEKKATLAAAGANYWK